MCSDVFWIQSALLTFTSSSSPSVSLSLPLLPFSPRCDSDCHSLLLWEALSHQSGRKECFTPGLQCCACQRRVCNPPPRFNRPVVFSDTSTPVCLWALCRMWPRDRTRACTDVCRVFTGKNGGKNRNLKCFDTLKNTGVVVCPERLLLLRDQWKHSHDRHVSEFTFCAVTFVSGPLVLISVYLICGTVRLCVLVTSFSWCVQVLD